LFLLDSDLDHIVTTTPTARSMFASVENNCAADHADAHDTSLITPRPSIGKKKAEEIAYGAVPGSTANTSLTLHLLLRAEERQFLSLRTSKARRPDPDEDCSSG
jgi:hypothetical protein